MRMIRKYEDGKFIEQPGLLKALGLDGLSAPIISVIGAGGKTTVIQKMADEYRSQKLPVIVTTTTHMRHPDVPCFLGKPDMIEFARILKQEKMVYMGTPVGDGKIGAFPMVFLEAVRILGVPMLIEADGARERPFKVPAEHEPVLWEKTTIAVGVMGLDAVGNPIKDVCHRPDETARFLGKKETDILTVQDMVTIGLSERGYKKHMDPYMKYHIILNKADNESRIKSGETIAELFARQGFHHVYLTSGLGGSHEDID